MTDWEKRVDLQNGWAIWDKGDLESGDGVVVQFEKLGDRVFIPKRVILAYALPIFARAITYGPVSALCIGAGLTIPRFEDFDLTVDLNVADVQDSSEDKSVSRQMFHGGGLQGTDSEGE